LAAVVRLARVKKVALLAAGDADHVVRTRLDLQGSAARAQRKPTSGGGSTSSSDAATATDTARAARRACCSGPGGASARRAPTSAHGACPAGPTPPALVVPPGEDELAPLPAMLLEPPPLPALVVPPLGPAPPPLPALLKAPPLPALALVAPPLGDVLPPLPTAELEPPPPTRADAARVGPRTAFGARAGGTCAGAPRRPCRRCQGFRQSWNSPRCRKPAKQRCPLSELPSLETYSYRLLARMMKRAPIPEAQDYKLSVAPGRTKWSTSAHSPAIAAGGLGRVANSSKVPMIA